MQRAKLEGAVHELPLRLCEINYSKQGPMKIPRAIPRPGPIVPALILSLLQTPHTDSEL